MTAPAWLALLALAADAPPPPPAPPAGAPNVLEFIDTGFENASPLQWETAPDGTVHIHLLYDYERASPNRAAGHWHFRLEGKPGSDLTLVLHDFDNVWNGRPGAAVSKKSICYVSADGRRWDVLPAEFLEGNLLRIRARLEGPALYLARLEPYRLSDLDRLLSEIRGKPLVEISEIGRTVEGRPLEIVRVGREDAPHRVLLRARSHAWEPGGNWVVQGLLRALLQDDDVSRRCLERCAVYVLPMANKDGVARGRTRFNLQGKDLNRGWDRPADPALAPENAALERWIQGMGGSGKPIDLAIDLHNDEEGGLHISRPPVAGLDRHVARMARLEALLRKHTPFTEGSSGPRFRNPGTIGEGLLERFGIDACILELNCNWIAGLERHPSGEAWEGFSRGLREVFREYFDEESKEAAPPAAPAASGAGAGAEAGSPFDAPVLDVRPRIFLRGDDGFEGLTAAKLRERAASAEFRAAGAREKWRARPSGRAILWLLDGKEGDRDAAIAGLRKMDAAGGTWSDRGPELVELAALLDWLWKDLDDAARRELIAKVEKAADAAVEHVRGGQAPFFYSRTPGALAGLAVAGLALHGASPKAEGYLRTFHELGVGEYFRAYRWVDGAATGANYTLHYTYFDLPAICAAWWSATGKNPADWIRREQGGWLDGIVRFYLWYMRPGFAFTDANDQFRGDWESHDEFCRGLDMATYVTRDGFGRAWSLRWLGRFGSALYHAEYAQDLVFRDPSVAARPLAEMPLAALFGRESCGYGFFRSSWPAEGRPDDATHVFFRFGDPMDVHGGVAAGEFQVFRRAPLAARSGRYSSYDSPPDQYHRNCISTNVVLFTDPAVPDDRGDQETRKGLKTDHRAWAEWLEIRRRSGLDVASITEWEVKPGEARCRADLTKANPAAKCRRWERELVWLSAKHLIVLDVVETARPEIRRTWQLHCAGAPEIGDRTIGVSNRPPEKRWADDALRPAGAEGRLACRTLLPEDYVLVLQGGGKAEAFGPDGRSRGAVAGNPHHLKHGGNVVGIDPGTAGTRTTFLHVLTATDAGGEAPAVSWRRPEPGKIEVVVDGVRTLLRE
jgi:hypothetical protein